MKIKTLIITYKSGRTEVISDIDDFHYCATIDLISYYKDKVWNYCHDVYTFTVESENC